MHTFDSAPTPSELKKSSRPEFLLSSRNNVILYLTLTSATSRKTRTGQDKNHKNLHNTILVRKFSLCIYFLHPTLRICDIMTIRQLRSAYIREIRCQYKLLLHRTLNWVKFPVIQLKHFIIQKMHKYINRRYELELL